MGITVSALDVIGGAAVVGADAVPGLDIVRLVRRGLPVGAVQVMPDTGRPTLAELDRIVLPRRTLMNRRKSGTLTPGQSDRLVRLARILAAAEETFGNQARAAAWLRHATTALGGERPLDLLDTDQGARDVEILLGHMAHSIAA